MARGKQHLKRRPTANARVAPQPAPRAAKRVKHESWEDQLFFSRLRVHAKWVFVFLAFAFALGFVVFGVGSGTSGITEAMQGLFHRNAGSTSVSSLQKAANAHPKNATAWRNLATKLETEQKTDRAAIALNHYLKLKPKDEGALQELAGLYTTRAGAYYTLYSQYSGQAQLVSPNSLFRPPSTSKIGQALASGDPILAAENTTVQTKLNSALQQLDLYNTKTVDTYKRLVKIAPQNATYQLQLGQTAANIGDTKTAETAYKTFLRLAPNDPLASTARKQLKALTASAKAKTSTATTSKSGG
jgi:tetratricopeptide (TPR) repeat protein